jgi:hypothetical protein
VRETAVRRDVRRPAHDQGDVWGRTRAELIDDGRVIQSWGSRTRQDRDDDATDVTPGTTVGVGDHGAIGIGGGGHGLVWRA